MTTARIARDISYANGVPGLRGQVVRGLENLTGRPRLIRRARGYDDEVAKGNDFWDVMVRRYGIRLELVGRSLADIPRDGPLVVVANHPFGVLDGLMMGHILSVVRGDFRILANSVFKKAEDLNRIVLPVDFDETREAMRTNLETRATALRYLADGGAIGVFPGGTVSTAAKPFSRPMDPGWRNFTAKMIARSGATVVPIYFDGANSRLFQLASHVHYTLRMALLIKEFRARVDEPVRVVVGEPVNAVKLAALRSDPKGMMDFLRRETYALSPRPLGTLDYGYEFEDKYRA